jgi:hypothetical protein
MEWTWLSKIGLKESVRNEFKVKPDPEVFAED